MIPIPTWHLRSGGWLSTRRARLNCAQLMTQRPGVGVQMGSTNWQGTGRRNQELTKMEIIHDWWSLMIVDDHWLYLMIIDDHWWYIIDDNGWSSMIIDDNWQFIIILLIIVRFGHLFRRLKDVFDTVARGRSKAARGERKRWRLGTVGLLGLEVCTRCVIYRV